MDLKHIAWYDEKEHRLLLTHEEFMRNRRLVDANRKVKLATKKFIDDALKTCQITPCTH